MKKAEKNVGSLMVLLQEIQVAVFTTRFACGLLHKLEELTQTFSLRGLHAGEANAHTGTSTSSHDAVQREALHPDVAAGKPKTNFYFGGGSYGAGTFYQTATHAGVGQVAPNWDFCLVHSQLDGDETSQAKVPATVLSPVWTRTVRLERRGRRRWHRYGTRWRLRRVNACRSGRILARDLSLDFAHRREQCLFAFFRRSVAVSLEQFPQMPD